jgi:hypothetical protein
MTQRYFVPASPGWFVLSLMEGPGDGEYAIERTPVVAWEMAPLDEEDEYHGFWGALVTTDWEGERGMSRPILGPDGRVRLACEVLYDNEAAWLKHAAAEARARDLIKVKAP